MRALHPLLLVVEDREELICTRCAVFQPRPAGELNGGWYHVPVATIEAMERQKARARDLAGACKPRVLR